MSDKMQTIYLVERWDWRVLEDYSDSELVEPNDPRPDVRPVPHSEGEFELVTYWRGNDEGGIPVRALTDYAQAEAFRREQEFARRSQTNPFRYGHDMNCRTSLDDGRLRDWLLDAGLTPPVPEGEEDPELVCLAWTIWWDAQRLRLGDQARLTIAKELAEVLKYPPDAVDLAWLDEQMYHMEELTPSQRWELRWKFVGSGVSGYPDQDGERNESLVQKLWRDWWDKNYPTMTEYQRHQVWEALDKVRFFEIVELVSPESR
jgi:hypothetical protein